MRRFHWPSPPMLVALLALFVALGGAGYAATGGVFVLGESNRADRRTSLGGDVPRALLRLTNESSADRATALRLRVADGQPPLRVNSSARVPRLNADRLDGRHAAGFVRRGEVRTFGPVRLGDSESARVTRIGPFVFRAYCADEGDYADGHVTVKSTVAHSAFASTDRDGDGNLLGEADMLAGRSYLVVAFQSDPNAAGRGFKIVSGMAVAPSGFAVDFDLYVAIYALGAVVRPCVFGGTAIVRNRPAE